MAFNSEREKQKKKEIVLFLLSIIDIGCLTKKIHGVFSYIPPLVFALLR